MADIKNLDVRMEIMKRGLKNYQVAEFIGVTETTFSKWLRTEMTPSKKEEVIKAINELCGTTRQEGLRYGRYYSTKFC